MVTKDEALKMAIEDAMKFVNTLNGYEDANQSKPFKTEADKYLSYASVVIKSLATSLKEALAQPAQEPVAWYGTGDMHFWKRNLEHDKDATLKVTNRPKAHNDNWRPLYTHPAPSWQGLSSNEVEQIEIKSYTLQVSVNDYEFSTIAFYEGIEQALKEKNKC